MYIKLKFNAPELNIDLDFEMDINEDEICAALDTLGRIGMDIINSETTVGFGEATTTETINSIVDNIKDVLDELGEAEDFGPDANSYDLNDTDADDSWDTDMDNSEEDTQSEMDNVWRVV